MKYLIWRTRKLYPLFRKNIFPDENRMFDFINNLARSGEIDYFWFFDNPDEWNEHYNKSK